MDQANAAACGGRTGSGARRSKLIALLYLVGVLSGFAAAITQSIVSEGLWTALGWAFGISVVDLAAVAVAFHLARQPSPTRLTRIDCVAVAVFLVLILSPPLAMNWPAGPARAVTWAAVAGLAVFEIARNRRCPTALAAASLFILLAGSVILGRAAAQLLAGGMLLSWDAWLAAGLLEWLASSPVERNANVIITDHGSLLVTASCSSLRNVLYGLLCWLTVARALRPAWQRGDVLAAVLVSAAVVAANTLRIALLGLSETSYERFHGILGENVFNLGLLFFTATVAFTAPRRAAAVAR
mgnify:CR=1 FL=1